MTLCIFVVLKLEQEQFIYNLELIFQEFTYTQKKPNYIICIKSKISNVFK